MAGSTAAFTATSSSSSRVVPKDSSLSMSDDWTDQTNDSNKWASADFDYTEQEDWQEMMARKNDGSFWSEFAPSADTNDTIKTVASEEVVDEADIWLDTLASISAEEIEFNIAENERADKVRQMQEWGFDDQSIENTFGVAMDDALEKADEVEGLKEFREQAYLEETDIDWKQVESHTQVEKDPETGEAIRQQMVYVDEHTCIGCTNCAMIAQSTFFMDDEHGRARVFQQWGDDDETIQIAIETCPVDCIHYVPYDELVRLEIDRRDQNINFKARLVNQGEYGGDSHRVGGANAFTAPQKISGNAGSRCNNCPSRGCKTCPMFGIGKNPAFEKKEKERKARIERNRLKRLREGP